MIELDKVLTVHPPTAPTNNPYEPIPSIDDLVWDKGDLLGTSPQTPSKPLLTSPLDAEHKGFDWIEVMKVANTGQFYHGFRWWKVKKTHVIHQEIDTWTFKGEQGLTRWNLGNKCDIKTKHFS